MWQKMWISEVGSLVFEQVLPYAGSRLWANSLRSLKLVPFNCKVQVMPSTCRHFRSCIHSAECVLGLV